VNNIAVLIIIHWYTWSLKSDLCYFSHGSTFLPTRQWFIRWQM